MSDVTRVGIVGHGCWVQQHVFPGLIAAGAEVVAIAGRDHERSTDVARTLGIALSFASAQEMIDGVHLDALVVAGPPSTHAEHVLAGFRAGLAVLCEKPVGLDSNETAALLQAQGEIPVVVGLTLRWHPAFWRVRELLLAGAIGDIRHVDLRYASPAGAAPTAEWSWHHDRLAEPGGVLSDLGPHAIELVRWLVGDIEAVYATGQTTIAARPLVTGGTRVVENADVFDLQLEISGGATAHVVCSRVHPPTSAGAGVQLTLLGDQGWMLLDMNAPAQLEVSGADGTSGGPQAIAVDWGAIARDEMSDFLQCARGTSAVADVPTLADGHAVQRVIDAALLADSRRARTRITE